MNKKLAFEVHLDTTYDEALERVAAALKTEGFGVLTTINVKNTFKEKLNRDFRPYSILGVCNPPLAHRALSHEPRAGLLLPCNVTVEAEPEGGALVRIGDPEVLLSVGGFGGDPILGEVAREAGAKLRRVAEAMGWKD